MPLEQNRRPIEAGVHRDLAQRLTYGEYLCIDELLSIQRPVSSPEHHDELLFIIQHQTSELWLKLIVHELRWAIGHLAKDDVGPCLKALARIKHVQKQLFEQWAVLATLTPSEYAQFRDDLGPASGFQSVQYRLVEYLLGNKNSEMLEVFAHDPAAVTLLHKTLTAPSLYDEFLRYLSRTGHDVPLSRVERDWTQPYLPDDGVVAVFAEIYQSPSEHWQAYELAEELVDLEESFQLWRFRHMHTVKRIIGHKRGTGGSSGVGFLRAALDLTFFPELFEVRTEIGSRRADG